jgi:hypothetical protein
MYICLYVYINISVYTCMYIYILGSEDKPLPLTVYNWKSRTFREVILVPSRRWPGEGEVYLNICM